MASAQTIAIRITLKNRLKEENPAIKDLFLGHCYFEPVEQAFVNQHGDRYIWNNGNPIFIKAL